MDRRNNWILVPRSIFYDWVNEAAGNPANVWGAAVKDNAEENHKGVRVLLNAGELKEFREYAAACVDHASTKFGESNAFTAKERKQFETLLTRCENPITI